ncbi:hypothetical protein F9Z84_07365 [Escherichia coli]|nr:hypothetical protein F9Z84_07365 [Escherichia coli]
MSEETKVAIMSGRPIYIPDPHDRSRNDPHYLMSSNDVLRLMKTFYVEEFTLYGADQVAAAKGKDIITEDLVNPIIDKALAMGWGKVKLVGRQLEFIAYF